MTEIEEEANFRRRPFGADNTTMLLWHAIEARPGITRDELVAAIGPRINVGHAKRRYLARRTLDHRKYYHLANGASEVGDGPTFENTDPEQAKRYLVTKTLQNMHQRGTARRDEQGQYRTGRKPRAARYQQDDRVVDPTGVRTRLHMTTNEALRIVKPALERYEQNLGRARPDARELRALKTVVAALEEARKDGFPGVG
jgi:hypothetical protein